MNFTAAPTGPTNALDMNQLNELLGGFKSDIMSGIDERFSSFQPAQRQQMPDYSDQFGGLEQRLSGLEQQIGGIQMPAYEPQDFSGQFGGLEDKIAGLEKQFASMPTPAGVDYGKISSLVSDQVNSAVGGLEIPGAPDLSGITQRLDQFGSRLDGLNAQPDLSPIQDQIGQLNNRFEGLDIPGVDYDRIGSMIGDQIGSIPKPAGVSLDPLMSRLDQLEGRFDGIPQAPGVDLSGIEGRLEQFGSRLDGLNTQPDLSPLLGEIGGLKDQVGGLMSREPYEVDLSPLQGDIAGLKDQFSGFMNNDRSDQLIGQFDDLKAQIGQIGSSYGGGDGGGGGGLNNGWTPPPITPQPQPAPSLQPAPVGEGMDWMRYGRDYGEADFNVGGTAGGQIGGGFPQPGAGGIDLNQMMKNLGLF